MRHWTFDTAFSPGLAASAGVHILAVAIATIVVPITPDTAARLIDVSITIAAPEKPNATPHSATTIQPPATIAEDAPQSVAPPELPTRHPDAVRRPPVRAATVVERKLSPTPLTARARPLPKPAVSRAASAPMPQPAPISIPPTPGKLVASPPDIFPAAAAKFFPAPRPSGHANTNRRPAYPLLARRRGLEGTVVVRAHIDPSGHTATVEVITSSTYTILDRAAVKAVAGWRFEPAQQATHAVAGSLDIPIMFRLDAPRR